MTYCKRLCAVTLTFLLSISAAWASQEIPNADRSNYISFEGATPTNVSQDGSDADAIYKVGSMEALTASISVGDITNSSEKKYILAFKARYNTEGHDVTVKFTFTDTSDESKTFSTATLTINGNNCTRGTNSEYLLQLTEALPVGNYTLTVILTQKASGKWGANFGYLSVLDPDSYDKYTALPCEKVNFEKNVQHYIYGTSDGSKLETGEGNSSGSGKYGLGSCQNGNYIEFYVTNTTAQDYVLSYLWKVGNDNAKTINITFTDVNSNKVFDQDFTVFSTSDKWRVMAAEIPNLPIGTYRVKISFTATSGWCPNLHNLAIVAKSSFTSSTQAYDSRLSSPVTLSKTYYVTNSGGVPTTSANEINSTRTGNNISYLLKCSEAGTYSLSFDASSVETVEASGRVSTITVQVLSADGMLKEETKTITGSGSGSDWSQYNNYTVEDISLAEGYYSVCLTFAKEETVGTELTALSWSTANVKNIDFNKTSAINQMPALSFAMNQGVRADRTVTQFKNDKLVDSNQNNSYIVYRANVTTAGTYKLSIGSYCDQPNTKQPKIAVLVTDANGTTALSQEFTITNPGSDIAQDEVFVTDDISLTTGICTIKLTFTSASGNTWTTNIKDMKVVQVLTLDETTAYTPKATEANVTLTRTMNPANNWYTFVAPFAMTAEQVLSNFGEGAKVAELKKNSDGNLTFENITAITANKPVMVKPTQAVSTITVDGVTIVEATPTQEDVEGVKFIGNYGGTITLENGDYFVSANKLYIVTGGTTTLKNWRAYFQSTSDEARLLGMVFDDDEVTGIKTAAPTSARAQNREALYDLQGRRIQGSQRKSGLYLRGGKICFAK